MWVVERITPTAEQCYFHIDVLSTTQIKTAKRTMNIQTTENPGFVPITQMGANKHL
ncbi:rCG23403 [Rattus norvegicus]|uniref:RCG23403 n=1 Tax=Rattus norvegicus TaxID=10116 RepID=A6KHA4_RAT|nr:rCG23403 [Rattus norvegicus]